MSRERERTMGTTSRWNASGRTAVPPRRGITSIRGRTPPLVVQDGATHLLIPPLKTNQQSYMLNVASLAAIGPMPYTPVCAASNAFVLSFTLALREELHRSGIGVSVLCPGGMPTNVDSAKRIGASGLGGKLSSVRPEPVGSSALARMLRGRACIIPGWLNKIVAVGRSFTPRTVFTRFRQDRGERSQIYPCPRRRLCGRRTARTSCSGSDVQRLEHEADPQGPLVTLVYNSLSNPHEG